MTILQKWRTGQWLPRDIGTLYLDFDGGYTHYTCDKIAQNYTTHTSTGKHY